VAYSMLLKRDRRSGRYHFRLQVPDDLRQLLGWELKRSLGTTNLAEAKKRYPAALEWAQGCLDDARRVLAERQHEVDHEALEDAYEASVTPAWREYDYAVRHGGRGDRRQEAADITEGEPEKWRRPFRSTPLGKLLRIEHPPQGDLLPHVPGGASSGAARRPGGVTVGAVFDAWFAERKPPERTRYEWQRAINALARHLGHPDAGALPVSEVTREALVAWKGALLAEGKLSGKTVKNRLDVIHALFNYALDNALMSGTNPAKGVKVAARQDPAARRLPYSEADAQLILAASRRETRDSKRWLPWLLLFTGTRLDEACQLMVADVRQDPEAGWYLDIHHGAPGEGKRLKNLGSARRVPLHRQIVAEGFLEYVAGLPAGSTLWPDLTPDRFGSRGGTATKVLGRWVRSLGITDPRKVLHSACHRFKDVCRAAGVPKDVHDALTGHTAGDVGSTYGLGHNLATLRDAVDRLPAVALPGST
jgi:integrase